MSTALREVAADVDLRRLLSGQYVAQAADGIAQAVFADQLVLEPLAQSTPGRILRLFALTLVPYSVVAPFLGVFVDRWRRRTVLVATNALRALLLATLPLWALALAPDSIYPAALLALLGLGRLFLTTKGAVLPVLLHERFLLRGNAVSSGGGMIAALFGGAIGVASLALIPPLTAVALAGVLYGISALILRRISTPLAHTTPDEPLRVATARVARDLWAGWVAIWTRANARWPLAGIFVLRTIAMFVAIAAILIIKSEFPGESGQLGRRSVSALALGAAGAGAFVGAATAPLLGRRLAKPQLIVLGFAVSGVAIALLGGVPSVAAVLTLTFVAGYGSFVAKVAVDAQVQEALPDDYRGRAFALYDILYNLASVSAGAIAVAFQGTPLRVLMITAGLLCLACAVGFRAAYPTTPQTRASIGI